MGPLQVSHLSPHEERCSSPEPFFHNPECPAKEPSAVSLFRERRPILRAPFIHLSKFTVDGPPSPGPQMGPLCGETPIPEPSSTHKPPAYEPSPRFPSKAPLERGFYLRGLLLHLQVPLTELP